MRFEELDWSPTPIGELTLRRRVERTLDTEVFEVRLGEDYLMSSLFTVAEEELARLGLARTEGDRLTVLVGGLGLGYTAVTALDDDRIDSLVVVDALEPVIAWHQRRLLPVSDGLVGDPRTRLVLGDFFALSGAGALPGQPYDAVLLDIDHTPRHVLDPSHASFYTADGLRRLGDQLVPGGVFALWSDDPPDKEFLATAQQVFEECEPHVVEFPNPLTGGTSANTVYVMRSRRRPSTE